MEGRRSAPAEAQLRAFQSPEKQLYLWELQKELIPDKWENIVTRLKGESEENVKCGSDQDTKNCASILRQTINEDSRNERQGFSPQKFHPEVA